MDVQNEELEPVRLEEPNGEPEVEVIVDHTFTQAAVGDMLAVAVDQEVSPEWRDCDGSVLISYEWPDFVERLAIAGPTFTLPLAERTPDGQRYVIKLGEHHPLPEPQQVNIADLPEDSPLKGLVDRALAPPKPAAAVALPTGPPSAIGPTMPNPDDRPITEDPRWIPHG